MIKQVKVGLIALFGVVIWGFTPGVAHAVKAHTFYCNDCHNLPSTVSPRAMANLCVNCHISSGSTIAKFDVGAASNALAHNPSPGSGSGGVSSHYWGGVSTIQSAAGSANPPTTFYSSSANISKNRITCTICHNPHAEQGTKLVRAATAGDLICQQCHQQWFVANPKAERTHPIVADYAAIAAANPTKFKATVTNVGSGDVRLINGGVSCTSCHGTHYADSASSTIDGTTAYNDLTLAVGDGNLLRSDGTLRTGGTRNGVNGTAQLRSNLCQACHTYKMHGKGETGDHLIGCLDCHGGHAYNGGTSNAYVLNKTTPDAVPTRLGTDTGPNPDLPLNSAAQSITFPDYPTTISTRTTWADQNVGTANGYCEKCHGDVNDPNRIGGKEVEHLITGVNPCTTCHKHNDPAGLYSFNIDANAATCGQCHGFPPYLNVSGNRDSGGVDGGYGYNDTDTPNYNYSQVGYFKDETKTAHKTHAGADLPTNPGEWYFVGTSGVENCKPCHGANLGSTGGVHRANQTDRPETFRDVPFSSFATAGGQLTPTFSTTTNKCSNVYCHTNGTPRTSDTTRDYSGVNVTPAWVGSGVTDGFNSIMLNANRCQFCHGNDATTMGVAQKKNSPNHLVHLNKGYSCEICHIATALSSTTLEPNATDGRIGGEHINGIADVSYKTTGSTLATALATNLVGTSYNPVTGTCSIYCHDPQDTGNTADWDSVASLQCDNCHRGLITDTSADGGYGPIISGSHLRHVSDATGPKLTCDKCHGAGAETGSHAGMLDGIVTVTAGVCNTCHAVDVGETVPVWGNSSTGSCVACHTGATTTPAGLMSTGAARALPSFLTTGHGKPSGNYAVTNNPAANATCNSCHATSSANHFDNVAGNDKVLIGGFDCLTCHDGTPAVAVKTHSNTDPAYTGQKRTDFTKQCLACHDPHGSSNLTMIAPTKSDFGGTVVFNAFGNAAPVANDNSFDESGDASNLDDICATCHTGPTHNNRAKTGTHNEGKVCTSCHSHNGPFGGFMPAGGNACNDCHDNPPATGAHVKHNSVTIHDLTEDRTDCDKCHPGTSSYTYAHSNTNLDLAPGITATTCTSACHQSSVGDGAWSDADGLNCDSCHYAANAATGANNTAAGSRALSAVHNEHFDKNKTCSDCHDVSYSPTIVAVAGPLIHITDMSGANEGAKFTGMGQALVDEALVSRASMTFDDGLNSCSGGIGIGCHASGTPDWDVTIPATGAGCLECHTDTNNATFNPVSGLHDNSPAGPTVTGNAHDGSFDNGSSGTADCVTCHSASPTVVAANHINGTLNTGTNITVQAIAGYTQGTASCATTCHSAGTSWNYKWSTSAYNTNGSECANCHGDYVSGWATGVAPHTENPTRGNKHNNTGTLTYPCTDCHAIGAVSGYNWTSKWDPTGVTSNHGDDKITMNQTAINTFNVDTAPNPDRAGCTTSSCHQNDAAHSLQVTTTTLTTQTVSGNQPSILCSSCHGGYAGTNANGYWPDGANAVDNLIEDNSGAHFKHMTALANAKYGETIALLLTNNGNGTADAKQKFLCAYCHTTPGSDGDHGIVASLPAEINGMYSLWDLTRATPDNGVFSSASSGTCATVDCHYNKTTPTAPTSFAWYGGQTGTCVMCHVDVAAEAKHTAHTGAATTFGRAIACADCHQAATNWVTNTAPATNHLNGAVNMTGTGAVTFTYDGSKSCGTNDCHEDGKGSAPKTVSYPWNGAALGNCTICHDASPTSDAHVKHLAAKVTSYVSGSCNDCHSAATNAAHINNSVSYAAKISAAPGDGSCTNTCHLSAEAGDWNGGSAAITCNDCHTATYVGGGTNMPTSGLHNITPAVSGKIHNETLNGSGCAACHTSVAAQATHVNGTLEGGNGQRIQMGIPAYYTQTADNSGTCATTTCHLPGSDGWAHVWTNTVSYYTNSATSCGGCHGDWVQGWKGGVVHRTNAGVQSTHGTGSSYQCKDCHALEALSGAYPFTFTSNDWAQTDAGATTKHGDGLITMNNSAGLTFGRSGGLAGCTGCHAAYDGIANLQHAFTQTSWTTALVVGDILTSGCGSCHGGATVVGANKNYWPDGANTINDNATADNSGAHLTHISKMATEVMGQTITQLLTDNAGVGTVPWNTATADAKQKELCTYCHTNPGTDADHGVTYPSEENTFYTIWNKTLDNGGYTGASGSCATTDCHNNVTTTAGYYWYAGGTSACAMCHSNGASDTTHTAHLTGTYGKTINCASCHDAATTSTVAPATGHINGTLAVSGSVTFTYSGGLTGSCGTNTCHNDGNGGTPYSSGAALGAYNWATPLTDCTACHNNPNATGNGGARHSKHMAAKVTTYVPGGCSECHPAATVATHIDGTRNATGSKQSAYASGNGTCTNTCHAVTVANGVWTDALAPTCTNCHSGTYIGGGANNASSGLHSITPSVSGKIHDATINGSGCAACHATLAAQTTTHGNGTLEGGNGQQTQMGLQGWYTQTADNTGTCATTTCHLSVSDPWAHVWTNTANYYTDSATSCGGCHGDYASGWKAGVKHTEFAARGNTQHTGTGTLTYACKDCHGIGSTNGAYNFTFASNDWKNIEAGTTQHGDGLITMNSSSTTWTRNGTRSGCSSCHTGATGTANAYDFPASSWTSGTIAGDAPTGGSCNSCHGYPPVQQLSGAGAAYTYAKVEDYSGGGRAHAVIEHLNPVGLDPTDLWVPCMPCHTEADHNVGLGIGNLQTQRDISGNWGDEALRYPRVNLNAAYDHGATATFNMGTRDTTNGMGYCSSTNCHFGESPKWDCLPADTANDPQ